MLRLAFGLMICLVAAHAQAGDAPKDVPLIIGNRTIHVFRAPLGPFSAVERAEGAKQRIERTIEDKGDGWSSVRSTEQGLAVEIDGKPMFYVVAGDARELAGETPEDVANRASRVLQKVWSEARESRDPEIGLHSLLKVGAATLLLSLVLGLIVKSSRWMQDRLNRLMEGRLKSLSGGDFATRIGLMLPSFIKRLSVLVAWVLGIAVVFLFLTFSLGQFAATRSASEDLSRSITQLLMQAVSGVVESLPGVFVSVIIFLVAYGATRLSSEFFKHVETLKSGTGVLNAHTAPATRRILNASLWLFAVAMAYPYFPGAHTEAFKGLSVILGLMVSFGASGLIGQIASGVMLVYTNALLVGEYVRIQDCEGTVTELGTFVTRLRTGLGEEISLPNSLVLANVTRNYSRATKGKGFVLDTSITIGYDTPWRQVHALLLEAANQLPEVLKTTAPFVVQTALSDFYVAYKLVVYVDSDQPATRARVASDLNAAIQDAFNRHGVQIMSPHYIDDPVKPKLVPESEWCAAPAKHREMI